MENDCGMSGAIVQRLKMMMMMKNRYLKIAAGSNGLTCLPKHGGARNNKFQSPILWLTFENVA
jgi:hypothetical protein